MIITHKYPLYRAYIGISHRGTLGSGYIQLSPDKRNNVGRALHIVGKKNLMTTLPETNIAMENSPF